MLDAASLVGRVVPGTRVGCLVNAAMPAALAILEQLGGADEE